MNPEKLSKVHPYSSPKQNWHPENLARQIMGVLAAKGNEFRLLSWEEFKDHYPNISKEMEEPSGFQEIAEYCSTSVSAKLFSSAWRELF